MQIFHWIFKAAKHEPSRDNPCDQQVNPKDIYSFRNRSRSDNGARRSTKSKYKDFKALFSILCRKDVAKACFYSTINLKQLATFNQRDIPRQRRASGTTMKKEDIIARGLGMVSHRRSADSAPSSSHHYVGNKVLPLIEAATSSTSTCETPRMAEIKEKVKGEKVRDMFRMKELLRWAAATRGADKGGGKFLARKVLMFKNRPALKAVPDDDELSIDSPKISFRWDVESCSTTTSSSRIDRFMSSESSSRKANWITTDSDYVVLEL